MSSALTNSEYFFFTFFCSCQLCCERVCMELPVCVLPVRAAVYRPLHTAQHTHTHKLVHTFVNVQHTYERYSHFFSYWLPPRSVRFDCFAQSGEYVFVGYMHEIRIWCLHFVYYCKNAVIGFHLFLLLFLLFHSNVATQRLLLLFSHFFFFFNLLVIHNYERHRRLPKWVLCTTELHRTGFSHVFQRYSYSARIGVPNRTKIPIKIKNEWNIRKIYRKSSLPFMYHSICTIDTISRFDVHLCGWLHSERNVSVSVCVCKFAPMYRSCIDGEQNIVCINQICEYSICNNFFFKLLK